MFSYTTYVYAHLLSIFVVLLSLGAIASHRLQGGTKANFKNRGFFLALHGLGLTIALVAGFGLISKGGFLFSSKWIWGKFGVWLALGMFPTVFFKQGTNKLPLFALIGVLATALYLVEFKPF